LTHIDAKLVRKKRVKRTVVRSRDGKEQDTHLWNASAMGTWIVTIQADA
jgi:hypothetical protein